MYVGRSFIPNCGGIIDFDGLFSFSHEGRSSISCGEFVIVCSRAQPTIAHLLRSLATNNMLRYGAHLRGTCAFWLARRKELFDQIHVLDSLHLFFTLSAANLQ